MDLTHVDRRGCRAHGRRLREGADGAHGRREGVLRTTAEVVELLRRDGLPKGDALATARIAGIMGAKRTPDLVPLCHPIALSGVVVELEADGRGGAHPRDGAHDRPHRAWRWRRSPRSRSPG